MRAKGGGTVRLDPQLITCEDIQLQLRTSKYQRSLYTWIEFQALKRCEHFTAQSVDARLN